MLKVILAGFMGAHVFFTFGMTLHHVPLPLVIIRRNFMTDGAFKVVYLTEFQKT